MKKLIPLVLIFFVLIFFQLFISENEKKNVKNSKNKYCKELNYNNHNLNKIENFSEIDINLEIKNNRKWKKIIFNTILSIEKDNSNTFDAKYSNVNVIIKNKFGFNCSFKAKIKPHGDLLDHFRDYKSGYDPIYALPSLKVKLIEGNIFGIVEFRLLLPRTRNAGNEILTTSLFSQLGLYAPRTAYANVTYNNKKYRFLFQEKINKEFLETNSLQEGLIFSGDERFVFKYESDDTVENDETGISKFRLLETKFLERNEIFIKPAIETLQTLNIVNYFYTSDTKQRLYIDFFTSQKNKIFEDYFKNLPEFDALMQAVGADHGMSRDDRRFYFDIVNGNFIPIYYDGGTNILSEDIFISPNIYSDVNLKLNNKKRFLNSAKIGAPIILKKIKNIDLNNFQEILKAKGLELTTVDLQSIMGLIQKNLYSLSNLSNDQLFNMSTFNQYPLKNTLAVNKNVKAKYLFIDKNKYKVCDLLLKNCNSIILDKTNLLKAISQKLIDKDDHELIFLGDINYFTELKLDNLDNIKNNKEINYSIEDINFKTYGNIEVKIDKKEKKINIIKNSVNSKVLFYKSMIDNWKIYFSDLSIELDNYISRTNNGLSGCINIYDSYIKNLKVYADNSKCEDAINFVRVNGSLEYLNITNALFDGIDADFSNLDIQTITVFGAGNDCSDFSYGNYKIESADLNNCADKGISVGENSKLESKKVSLLNTNIGIATKDSSVSIFKDVVMQQMSTCITAYKKKKEFNGGNLIINNLKCDNYKTLELIDNYSKIVIKKLN